jgi:hypothetical protein
VTDGNILDNKLRGVFYELHVFKLMLKLCDCEKRNMPYGDSARSRARCGARVAPRVPPDGSVRVLTAAPPQGSGPHSVG